MLSCQEGRVLIVSRRPRSSGKLSSAANANVGSGLARGAGSATLTLTRRLGPNCTLGKRRSLQWGTDRLALLEPGMVGVSRQAPFFAQSSRELSFKARSVVLQGFAAEHKSITLLHVR